MVCRTLCVEWCGYNSSRVYIALEPSLCNGVYNPFSLSLQPPPDTPLCAAGNFQIGPLYLPLMKVVAAADERLRPKRPEKGADRSGGKNYEGFGGKTSPR